jgi:ribonuclease P protein component
VKRRFRLRSSTDFERVRRSGKSFPHPLVVLICAQNDLEQTRIGVAAGRSVGNAVARNRAKRVLRACVDAKLESLRPGWDLVLLARQPLVDASFQEAVLAVERVLRRAKLLVQSNEHEPTRLLE